LGFVNFHSNFFKLINSKYFVDVLLETPAKFRTNAALEISTEFGKSEFSLPVSEDEILELLSSKP